MVFIFAFLCPFLSLMWMFWMCESSPSVFHWGESFNYPFKSYGKKKPFYEIQTWSDVRCLILLSIDISVKTVSSQNNTGHVRQQTVWGTFRRLLTIFISLSMRRFTFVIKWCKWRWTWTVTLCRVLLVWSSALLSWHAYIIRWILTSIKIPNRACREKQRERS